MHLKIPVLVGLLVLLAAPPTTLKVPLVAAVPGPPGGVDDPANVWAPYGPLSSRLQINFYPDENVEFDQFELGNLDLTDWAVPKTRYSSYDANPDFVLTQGQGEFSMFGIDFNHESSTWASWGCNFRNGMSACGVQIRAAFAHLVDRPRFVLDSVVGGAGQALADPTPPAKDPPGSPLATQNTWDSAPVNGHTHVTTNAYNIADDSGGFPALGSPDFCAARDHLIAAGIGLTDSNNNCVIDVSSPGLPAILAHRIRFMIRNDDPRLLALGLGLLAGINQVFGTSVVAPSFGGLPQLGFIVTVTEPYGSIDDWDMYTFAFSSLPGPFADHLRALYSSLFASNQCGGTQNGQPLNYGFICIPEFDRHIDLAAQTIDIGTFRTETLAGLDVLGRYVANIPVFSRGSRFVTLRDMNGVVNQRGIGPSSVWTLLNARNDPSYIPVNSVYSFGGGSDILRWGQKRGTSLLNPFWASTFWDFNVLNSIYDTLFTTSPIEPTKVINWMANTVTSFVDSSGNTHLFIELRQGLRWHYGPPVTADDVKFTILNYRDVPASSLVAKVQLVLNVNVINTVTVEVILQGQSISHLIDLAGVPIIPKRLWDTNSDGIADLDKTAQSFDPLTSGILIGSGPFVCRSVFPGELGRVGTGCARSADGSRTGQTIAPGGNMLLQRFDRTGELGDSFAQYFRSYNAAWGASNQFGQFQEWSWTDKDDDAKVSILDLTSVASCVGSGPSAFCSSSNFAYWNRLGNPSSVDVEANFVAAHLDDKWVAPFNWNNIDLQNIVPFQA